ncbi:helix-turn-helix domain-containing protein [Arthrobacter sp. NPDC090010]|uniref:helix-turn-helix domain-containing protein n=1 Tax=Arthrobacter sp. NPDC090010 TaxID=3363942 RepID=UPI003806CE63
MVMNINTETARLIKSNIEDFGLTEAVVAEKAGIAPSTLRRKLRGESPWTATEVFNIAKVLRIAPSRLLPASFSAVNAA